jgi:hypothetical protein
MTHHERPAFALSDTTFHFSDADLVDTLRVAASAVTLGGGPRLSASSDELFNRLHCDVVPSPSGMVHHLFWRG